MQQEQDANNLSRITNIIYKDQVVWSSGLPIICSCSSAAQSAPRPSEPSLRKSRHVCRVTCTHISTSRDINPRLLPTFHPSVAADADRESPSTPSTISIVHLAKTSVCVSLRLHMHHTLCCFCGTIVRLTLSATAMNPKSRRSASRRVLTQSSAIRCDDDGQLGEGVALHTLLGHVCSFSCRAIATPSFESAASGGGANPSNAANVWHMFAASYFVLASCRFAA